MSVRFNFVLSKVEAEILFEALSLMRVSKSGYDPTYIECLIDKVKSSVDNSRLLKARKSLISALHELDLATE